MQRAHRALKQNDEIHKIFKGCKRSHPLLTLQGVQFARGGSYEKSLVEGFCVARLCRDRSGAPQARQFWLDLEFSDELPVVFPAGPFGLQVGFLGLHGAIHVGGPRGDCVIAGRGRGELVGE